MKKNYNIEISKRGIPCIWESGGGWTRTGEATVIAGSHGESKNNLCENTWRFSV